MIVTFGEALIDLFGHPRGSTVDTSEYFVPHTGGALANVALTCARLGAPVRFVGAVGRDAHGDRVVREFTLAGVDTSCVARVPERTAVTFVRVGNDGSRAFLFYRVHTADHAMSPEILGVMAHAPLEGATFLVTGTSALVAEPIASAFDVMVREATLCNIPRVVDLNVRPHLWNNPPRMHEAVRRTLHGCAVVKASEEDLQALGLPGTLDALQHLAPEAVCLLTLAERGAEFALGAQRFHGSAPSLTASQIVDSTGAGDAFIAGVMSVLARKQQPWETLRSNTSVWHDALAVGCQLGALAVTAMGATTAVKSPWPAAVTLAFEATSAIPPTP
jgi:fructokinase